MRNKGMTTQLQAIYENGVLRPLQPLPFAERQCVTITISDENASVDVALDQAKFVLSTERWEAFCALLDRPPRQIPALQKLLTQPSILDDNRRSA
jgi:predicted DNA-binding antitoxin AbrB/MazE fold protein